MRGKRRRVRPKTRTGGCDLRVPRESGPLRGGEKKRQGSASDKKKMKGKGGRVAGPTKVKGGRKSGDCVSKS